ncbi:histamine N-methyltransferase-like [Acanthaster planci]|uniref:Histamine N-methyltransferase-like n=1 Tax=Acanthaster planci TaxID=133434 RepID=A0A8B7ZEA6_ACAPL|nr:histamine N-methyltransferase-like [Acanthaster planci]
MEHYLPSLFHGDAKYYLQSLHAFRAACIKYPEYDQWEETIFQQTVVSKLKSALDEQGELRVMGVGSGSGERECKMLIKLLQHFPRINIRAVEPLQEQLVKYQALTKSKTSDLRGVNFEWRQQTIEEYEKVEEPTKFHFIVAVHSVYYFDNLEDSLMYLHSILEPGGVIFIDMKSDDSGLVRYWNHFAPYFHSKYNFITSADVRSILDRHGIPYSQHHEWSRVNITSCFDDASEEGSMVLDFLNHVTRFKESAAKDLKQQVLEYLASSACSEKSGDEILLINDCDTIIISKPLK